MWRLDVEVGVEVGVADLVASNQVDGSASGHNLNLRLTLQKIDLLDLKVIVTWRS